jgi:hypothetical protein
MCGDLSLPQSRPRRWAVAAKPSSVLTPHRPRACSPRGATPVVPTRPSITFSHRIASAHEPPEASHSSTTLWTTSKWLAALASSSYSIKPAARVQNLGNRSDSSVPTPAMTHARVVVRPDPAEERAVLQLTGYRPRTAAKSDQIPGHIEGRRNLRDVDRPPGPSGESARQSPLRRARPCPVLA